MTTKIKLSHHTRESALIYASGITAACVRAKVKDPVSALTDTDDYPRLMKIPNVEFMIGWLTGVAEANEMPVEEFWKYLGELATGAKRGSRKRRAA